MVACDSNKVASQAFKSIESVSAFLHLS